MHDPFPTHSRLHPALYVHRHPRHTIFKPSRQTSDPKNSSVQADSPWICFAHLLFLFFLCLSPFDSKLVAFVYVDLFFCNKPHVQASDRSGIHRMAHVSCTSRPCLAFCTATHRPAAAACTGSLPVGLPRLDRNSSASSGCTDTCWLLPCPPTAVTRANRL